MSEREREIALSDAIEGLLKIGYHDDSLDLALRAGSGLESSLPPQTADIKTRVAAINELRAGRRRLTPSKFWMNLGIGFLFAGLVLANTLWAFGAYKCVALCIVSAITGILVVGYQFQLARIGTWEQVVPDK
jgi:hypothetical protein